MLWDNSPRKLEVSPSAVRPGTGELSVSCYRQRPPTPDGPIPPSSEEFWYPTNAEPGSREKIEVMQNRKSKNLPAFHPEDKI